MFRKWEEKCGDTRFPWRWRSSGLLGKDRDTYGPYNSLVVQKGGGEGGGVSDLCGELPWIPYGEVIDACSHAGLERGYEGGVLRPFPP